MAAYERERDCWQEIQWTCGCTLSSYVWKSVQSRAVLASGSVTKMNRRGLPLPVAVRDCIWPWLQCSETGHWCERRRQCTREQVPWEDRQHVIKDSAGAGHPRHQTSKAVAAFFSGVPGRSPTIGQSDALHRSSALCHFSVLDFEKFNSQPQD